MLYHVLWIIRGSVPLSRAPREAWRLASQSRVAGTQQACVKGRMASRGEVLAKKQTKEMPRKGEIRKACGPLGWLARLLVDVQASRVEEPSWITRGGKT